MRHEEIDLGESAVDVGGGSEVAAERFEPFEGTVGKVFFASGLCAVMKTQGCALIAASGPSANVNRHRDEVSELL